MSTPAGPPDDAVAAALAPGMTLQDVAVRLAKGVCAAYAAYNNGANQAPKLDGYHGFNEIMVYEFDPNVNPFSVPQAQAKTAAAVAAKTKGIARVEREPAAYARSPDGSPPPCVGSPPIGTPTKGYQLFGFTATANDHSHNLLVLRGTVTPEEAGYDLLGWGDNTACMLPSQSWSWEQQNYGQVNSYLYALYANTDFDTVTSLAKSCLTAIQTTSAQAPNLPWYLGAHSLGGAMLSLAALDAVVSKVLTSTPVVMTFGSLHVGDQSFASNYTPLVRVSYRVANLCDFVPAMVSLEPVTPTDPYIHVGLEGTFVWQTWDDWGNHSLANIYLPMVQSYWNVIKWGKRIYPQ